MKKYNFDDVVNRRNTSSSKWDVLDNELPMWVADMDFHVLPEIKEAIVKKANVDAYGYSEVPNELFEAYISWWKYLHNVTFKREEMIYCSGVIASLDVIFKYLTSKGDGITLLTPVYNVFYSCIKNNGLKLNLVSFIRKENHFEINWLKLEKALKKSKVLLLCNPHNPLGRLFTYDELKRIVSLAKENKVLIISDEIHCDLTDPEKSYVSILKFTNYKKIITLLSPSKAFNVAGLQSSVIVTKDKRLHDLLQKAVYKEDVGEPNYFACDVVIAAYTKGYEYIKELNEYIYLNKCYVKSFIEQYIPHLTLIDSEATYLLWIDVSYYSNNSEVFASSLRKETGLYVSNGLQYGKEGSAFIRLNIATSLKNVKDAMNRLLKFVSNK